MMPPETLAQGAAAGAPMEASEFESLLNKAVRVNTPEKQTAVQNAVRTLAQQALASTQLVSADVTKTSVWSQTWHHRTASTPSWPDPRWR